MKKIKAVVLEISGSQYVVLVDDGSFRRLPNKYGVEVGEEIELKADAGWDAMKGINIMRGMQAWKAWAAAAALLLLTLTVALGWNFAQASTAVAFVSLDINPSVELTVNAREQVLKVSAVNSDGEKILQNLELKNLPVLEAMSKIMEQAVGMGYLTNEHSWVLVGLAPNGGRQLSPALEEAVKSASGAVQEKVKAKVAVLQLTDQERVQAEQTGVSIGEYALWQSAKKAGVKVEAQELKTKTERVRLLETPEIQAQVLKDTGVLHVPEADGKNSPAAEDRLDQDRNNDKNNPEEQKNLNRLQEREYMQRDKDKDKDDERTDTGSANRTAESAGKSGKQDSKPTVPIKPGDGESKEQERGNSPQHSVPVLSPDSPAAGKQDNEIERTKEDTADEDKEGESGKISGGESEQERSGRE
ncbi:MAG: anti-sigma factor domain-containing protein [Desulfitobacteriaceae bacterium]